MDLWNRFQENLLNLTQASWGRDLLLLIGVTLLAYLPARFVSAPIRRRAAEREKAGGARLAVALWSTLAVTVWPLASMLALAVLDEILLRTHPEYDVRLDRVVPMLGFFLLYRVVSALAKNWIRDKGRLARFRYVVLPLVFLAAALQQLGLLDDFFHWADRPLLHLGARAVSFLSISLAILLVFAFFAAARVLSRLLGTRILPGMGLDRPLSEALGTVIRYALIAAGVLVGLDTLGLDLSTLQIGLGALGVGIGFGLQGLVQNFVAGLILLFEGTIKRGDVVSVEGESAKVLRIGLRSSVVRNRKGHEVVLPNSVLTSNPVINFSLSDSLVRIDVPFGVSYASDPRRVEELVLQCAGEHPEVLDRPAPSVFFMNYGDSSIDFELRAWLDDEMKLPQARSDLLYAIWYALKEAGIEIPFPQRDLHIRSGGISIHRDSGEEDLERPGGGGEVG